jgi:serine/threonine protein kinase/formylglycine-generating enzyme required for sulfatase activity
MEKDRDLLFAILALQMGFLTRDQIVECGAVWASDRAKSLPELLAEKGYLAESTRLVLDALVAEHEAHVGGGDAGKSLGSITIDEDVRHSLLGLPLGDTEKRTLVQLKARPCDPVETVVLTREAQDRYTLGPLLGQGGLGRVVEATDQVLGRKVAVKEMIQGTESARHLRRFLREGEIAGALSHPNIIPVHDIGIRTIGGAKTPFFVMTCIEGRDLKEILKSVEREDKGVIREFSRHRLLQVFQDVCLAMAYAHDQGVIHRDLKPANIMVGHYGEVYVVDWGLAKVIGTSLEDDTETLPSQPSTSESSGAPSSLTVEGDILGTPAYMPPEQADGRVNELDERSDIYSLGAILYEILTFRPPFTGSSKFNLIARVLLDDVTPPTKRAQEVRKRAAAASPDVEVRFPEPVPQDLEDIVLKALAKKKENRYQEVKALYEDIQRCLEGEKARLRDREKAMAKVREGHRLMVTLRENRKALSGLTIEAERRGKEVLPSWRLGNKVKIWRLEEDIHQRKTEAVKLLGEIDACFSEALSFEFDNKEARAGLAQLNWEQFQLEKKVGDEFEMLFFQGLVRKYNDGPYDGLLDRKGTLEVSSLAYECDCILNGRPARKAEAHLLAMNSPYPTPQRFETLHLHGKECRAVEKPGIDVWLFEYVESDRILVPRGPCGERNLAALPLDHVSTPSRDLPFLLGSFSPDSPYVPRAGHYLGQTPIDNKVLPVGRYLLVLNGEGLCPVRIPIEIRWLEKSKARATMYRSPEIPEGFSLVSGGRFLFQGDEDNPYSGQPEEVETLDFLMGTYPVTCAEYADFLNCIFRVNPDVAMSMMPRMQPGADPYWPVVRVADGEGKTGPERLATFVPTAERLAEHSDLLHREQTWERLAHCSEDWQDDWPVFGISTLSAKGYCQWKSLQDGHYYCLPNEVMWERAARGGDRRLYPWGDRFDAQFCCMRQSAQKQAPSSIHSFPIDESPFGIRGIAGNSRDICMRDVFNTSESFELLRGGGWCDDEIWCRSASRGGDAPEQGPYDPARGFRICIKLSPRSRDIKRGHKPEVVSIGLHDTPDVIAACPVCHEEYEADSKAVGEQFACEVCGVSFTIYDKRLSPPV